MVRTSVTLLELRYFQSQRTNKTFYQFAPHQLVAISFKFQLFYLRTFTSVILRVSVNCVKLISLGLRHHLENFTDFSPCRSPVAPQALEVWGVFYVSLQLVIRTFTSVILRVSVKCVKLLSEIPHRRRSVKFPMAHIKVNVNFIL